MRACSILCGAALSIALAMPVYADDNNPAISIVDLPPLPEISEDQGEESNVAVYDAQLAREEIISGASKREQSLGSVASAVTVISGDQLRRFGYRTVAEALAGVAGMYIADDRSVERVGIRGIQLLGDANTRILVVLDGTSLNEPWSQYVDSSYALPVHLDEIERIEVIRGPVSSVYGTNAFLGIVNIVTVSADKGSRVFARAGADSLGSVNGNAGFGTGTINRQVRGHVSWMRRGAETLEYPEWEEALAENTTTDADRLDAVNGGIEAHYDRLFFQARAATRTRQLPNAPYNAVFGDPDNKNSDTQLVSEFGYTRELTDNVDFSGRVYAAHYRFRGLLKVQDVENVDGMNVFVPVTFETQGISTWFGGELRGFFDFSSFLPSGMKGNLTTGVAAEFSDTTSESVTEERPDSMLVEIDRSFNTQGLYTELNFEPVSWAAATAGVRYDLNSLFDSNVSPRTALFFHKGEDYGIKFLYARGFRNPSVYEAFYEDGRRFIPPCSPNCETEGSLLRSETISSFEAVAWARLVAGWKARLSGWQWDAEDLLIKRDDTLANGAPYSFFRNQSTLTSRGAEIETSYRDSRGWFGYGSLAYSQVEADDNEQPNAPEILGKVGASTPLIAGLVHISSELSYIGSRLTRTKEELSAFWGWNAAVYVPNFKGFDITVGARNLIGTRMRVPVPVEYNRSFIDSSGVPAVAPIETTPGPGREFFARAGYRF